MPVNFDATDLEHQPGPWDNTRRRSFHPRRDCFRSVDSTTADHPRMGWPPSFLSTIDGTCRFERTCSVGGARAARRTHVRKPTQRRGGGGGRTMGSLGERRPRVVQWLLSGLRANLLSRRGTRPRPIWQSLRGSIGLSRGYYGPRNDCGITPL